MAIINDRYNNNPMLPKAGTLKEISEEHREEFRKCMEDPIYFAEKYFQIVHQKYGQVPMELYPYQKDAIKEYLKYNKLIMATARQVGKTSIATVIILHTALFNKKKNIAVLANRLDTSIEVLERVKLAYEYLPDWLKGGVKKWNAKSVHFENGSKIFADATKGNSVRGKSIYLLYIDEFAFIDNYDEFASAVLPTVSSHDEARIIFTSTPNGLNHFYDYCIGARDKINGFGYIEVPWYDVPGRDEAWKQKTLAEMNFNLQRFAQEQEVEFMGSSGTLISGACLKRLNHIEPYHTDGHLNMYQQVKAKHEYAMLVDVSRGKGLDYSTIQVIDVSVKPFVQVCSYRNNMIVAPDFAAIVERIARYFNNAHLLIELNDLGSQVSDIVFENGYENILMTETKGRLGKQISTGFGGGKIDRGIVTTATSKMNGCAMIKMIIEQGQLIVNDAETINELKTFSLKGKSYEAEENKHDDLVMGLVLFGWLADQKYFRLLTDSDVLSAVRESDNDSVDDNLLFFGIVNDGLDSYVDTHRPIEVSYEEFDSITDHPFRF